MKRKASAIDKLSFENACELIQVNYKGQKLKLNGRGKVVMVRLLDDYAAIAIKYFVHWPSSKTIVRFPKRIIVDVCEVSGLNIYDIIV